MEGKRFDHLARTVAASGSRRQVLAGLLAGALGSLRFRAAAADDSGTAIADASGGNHNFAGLPDQSQNGNDNNRDEDHGRDNERDNDRDNERRDKGSGQGNGRDNCNAEACPRDPSTGERGFCCPGGYCSCGGECCPDCGVLTEEFGEEGSTISREREVCCGLCSGPETCCLSCDDNGTCIDRTPIGGGSIRRR